MLKFYKLIGSTIKKGRQRLEDYLVRRGLLKTPPNPSPYSSLHSSTHNKSDLSNS